MKPVRHNNYITTIENFWSKEKCDAFIQRSEAIGYGPALINTELGQKRVEGVRNNQRVLFTDQSLADEIWTDLNDHIQLTLGNSNAVGLNEMFRFL